jgi:hypothetical protein
LREPLALAHGVADLNVEAPHDARDARAHPHLGADPRLDDAGGFYDRTDIASRDSNRLEAGGILGLRRADTRQHEDRRRYDGKGASSPGNLFHAVHSPVNAPERIRRSVCCFVSDE